MDAIPNWLKPIPGLLLLVVAFVIYLNGYFWLWGWAIGVVLLCAGIMMIKKDDGHSF